MKISPWSDAIPRQYQQAAEKFGRKKRDIIQIVAEELLRRRRMTGDELSVLLSSQRKGAICFGNASIPGG